MYKRNLLRLGIGADLKGFEMLNHAIEIYESGDKITELCTRVAVEFHSTRSRTERDMRYAKGKAGEKITLGQFIAKYKILWEEVK